MKNYEEEKKQKPQNTIKKYIFKTTSQYFKMALVLPVMFFVLSTVTLFLLVSTYLIKNGSIISFFQLSSSNKVLFYFSFFLISVCGSFLIWIYSSILIQRFSVPEMQKIKIYIYFMFSLGIISNFVLLMYAAFTEEVLIFETKKSIKGARFSLSLIFFLSYIFFNLVTSVFSIKIILYLQHQNNKNFLSIPISLHDIKNAKIEMELNSKLKTKTILIYLAIFVLFIYIGGVVIQKNQNKGNIARNMKLNAISQVICEICPYLLFLMNSFLNFSFYNEILYTKFSLNRFIDKEFFKNDLDNEYDDSDEEYGSCSTEYEEKIKLKDDIDEN